MFTPETACKASTAELENSMLDIDETLRLFGGFKQSRHDYIRKLENERDTVIAEIRRRKQNPEKILVDRVRSAIYDTIRLQVISLEEIDEVIQQELLTWAKNYNEREIETTTV